MMGNIVRLAGKVAVDAASGFIHCVDELHVRVLGLIITPVHLFVNPYVEYFFRFSV